MSQPEKTKKKQKEILDLIRSEHHEIANHGWDHDPMYNSKHTEKDGSVRDGYREEYKKHGTTRVKDDFINNYKYISSLLPGAMTSRCRLPGDGRHWGPFVQMLERDLGLSHYGWNFEFATWKLGVKTWQGIYLEGRWATSSALPDTPGVILFHDRHWKGKKALLVSIINKLKEARDIVTLEDFDALTEIDKASSAYRTVKFFHKKGRKPDGELTMGI